LRRCNHWRLRCNYWWFAGDVLGDGETLLQSRDEGVTETSLETYLKMGHPIEQLGVGRNVGEVVYVVGDEELDFILRIHVYFGS
jgi:hypothetical protein